MPVAYISFSEYLTAHMIPEWKKEYISYEELNSVLIKEQRQDFLYDKHNHQQPVYQKFISRWDEELKKVELFFSEKLTEANKRLAVFGIIAPDGYEAGTEHVLVHSDTHRNLQRKKTKVQKLKMAVGELYLSLAFLQSYQELNYKAFCKLTKRSDATLLSERGLQWRSERLDTSMLYTERSNCKEMMFRLETFMLQLEGGNEERAMRSLEIPPRETEQTAVQWKTFRIGVTCGLVIALLTCIAFKVLNGSQLEHVKPLLQLYRGSFLLIEFLSLMGISMFYWRITGINHVLIFELDPRSHLSHQHILEVAGWLAVCWCASLLACLHPSIISIPLHLHPLFFHSLLLVLLLNPTPTCHSCSRRWLLTELWKVMTAPLWPVGFADCWLADQLNSLSPLVLSLWDVLVFYSYQTNWADLQDSSFLFREIVDWERQTKVTCLIQCFSPWLRFAQCLRCFWDSGNIIHLLNAGKYSTVFIMVIFAGLYNTARERTDLVVEVRVYLYLWAMATCISVLVTVSWDLKMDWGLLQGNGLLKEELMYPREEYYYAAMLADVLLRISWAINILLAQMKNSAAAATASAILAPLEVLRRCIWNFFRLENDHLKNCRQCRAVRDFDLQSEFSTEKLVDQDVLANVQHNKSSTSCFQPTCLLIRSLRSRVKEINLPVQRLEVDSVSMSIIKASNEYKNYR
ncbi:xenotropic and polytropic retrovirus receptor 1 homolog [Trichomycterus rosablanca]|uniref:xenotropic and polytropic retrovirus receptor 1 homolog n=1 Tax=Trichomycterus rosablanca TaxID=2290929 RepID=UPI002F357340